MHTIRRRRPMQQWAGEVMIGISLTHLAIAVTDYAKALRHAFDRGWPGFFTREPSDADLYTLWFVAAGLGFLVRAESTRRQVRDTGTAPHIVGWGLIGIAIVCIAVQPQTGAYLLFVPGVMILTMPEETGLTTPA